MDLTRMMRDTSLTNLQWLNDPKTYEPQDKDTDQKDDLAIEWGRGDVSAVERPHTTIKSEMKLDNSIKDTEVLVEYVQVLLHQGLPKEEVMRQAKFRFPQETIDAAAKDLARVFTTEGIAGCVAIDVRNAARPARIVQAAMKSPFKRHIAFILMDPEEAAKNAFVKHRALASDSGETGSIDGFFASTTKVASSEMIYEPLNLPVLVSRADLDPSYYDATLIDLVNTNGLTEDEARKLYSSDGDAWKKLSTAFRMAMRRRLQRNTGSETASDKSSEFKMDASEMDVQIDPRGREALEVDGTPSLNKSSTIDIPQRKAKKNLSVFMVTGPVTEDIELDGRGLGSIDEFDPSTVIDEEFIGGDLIDLDDVESPEAALDVEGLNEFGV